MGSLLLKIISLLLILPILFTGCRDSVDRQLAIADTLMDTAPDSALSILKDIDTCNVKESQRPLLYLLLTKATVKSFQNIESDSIIGLSEYCYDGRKDSLEVLSKLYYGMALRQQGRYEDAITPLTLAYDLANQLKEHRWTGIAARELSFIYD
ncbi:MAG: hypothetical protein K2H60_15395 [Muribaculaceae bacterium]|nr:hypothetical protein [Muribaculaceae bacterium]